MSDNDSPVTSPKKRKRGATLRNDKDEPYFEIGKTRRVTIRTWKGTPMIDIREFYINNEGELAPGKKGISLSLQQYRDFKAIIDDIDSELGESKNPK